MEAFLQQILYWMVEPGNRFNMEKKSIICLSLIFLVALLCSAYFFSVSKREVLSVVNVPPSNERFKLSVDELKSEKNNANKGDASAAISIAQHYRFSENDIVQYVEWLRRAEELGDVSSGYNWRIIVKESVRKSQNEGTSIPKLFIDLNNRILNEENADEP